MQGQTQMWWRDVQLLGFSCETNMDFLELCVTHAIKNSFYYKVSELWVPLDV